MEPSTPAEQRAFAVARIKRATSLPRMKDGRRPPMHDEAVSEGERSQLDRQDEGADAQLSGDSPVMSDGQGGDDTRQTRVEPEPEVDTEHSETKADDPKTEDEPIISPPATPLLPDDAPTKSRRRSRSRSRGRSPRDFKGKAKVTQSPHPTNAVLSANDSSPDEGPVASTSQPGGFTSPTLISPIPAPFALLQAQRFLASPEPGMIYPGTSPPTPMLPTLQDIQREALQRGLFRSNSAAARLMALQRLELTGPVTYDPSLASPPATPPPLPGKIYRNNTVGGSGGERIAARKMMMRQLGKRLKEAEAEHTSGGEDPQPATPGRRKRRSKRHSVSRLTVVDDREPPSAASPTTPVLQIPALPPPTPETSRDEHDIDVVLPARSPTPNPRSPSVERSRKDALDRLTGESQSYGYETALERRGVVIEEEDDAPDHDHGQASPIPRSTYNGRSDTPPQIPSPCPPHAPGAPSGTSAESADGGVPAYLPDTAHEQRDVFPTSPFATPLRERQGPDEEEEDSRTENDTARRSPWNDAYDREISWVAELVPERIPINDDVDSDDADDTDEPRDHPSAPQHHSDPEEHEREDDDESLPRASAQGLVVDIETSPEAPKPSQIPPSPSSAIVLHRHFSDDSRIFPARLSISSPSQPELSSPNAEYQEWEESLRVTVPKKNGESSQRPWDRVKNVFARPGSSNGRRSRTNSIRERANNTDSSTSRESGASLTGASKTDKDPASSYLPSSPGAVSPVPPASSEALLKYGGDSKLFPFPGIFTGVKRLEEERRTRGGGLSLNASSPDIASPPTVDEVSAISSGSASSRTPQASPEISRDRKLSHQASDTRLFQKFNPGNTPPALSSPSTSTTQPDPTTPLTPNNSGWLGGKLPTNREGVKRWLSAKGLFQSQSPQPLYPGLQPPVSAPAVISQPGSTDVSRKPSLSDLLDVRKASELMTDLGEVISRTPTTTNDDSTQGGESQSRPEPRIRHPPSDGSSTPETPAYDKPPYDSPRVHTSNGDAQSVTYPAQSISPAPDNSSATPDPTSSLDGYASQSSPSSSSPERFLESTNSRTPRTMILDRLDVLLGNRSRGPTGTPFVDDPPRRLLLSSQVLQVANSNTVKDRFLFLFNDILIVAKPVTHDYDALLDMNKPSPLDRKFIVKSVVQLRDVRFTADRDDLPLSSLASISRSPLVRTFVVQFAKDADNAISHFFEKSGTRDDPTVLGQLLFRMLDLDRAKLGDYLSRRTSKVVLKAFIGSFGFGGVRIDRALRVFLQSLHLAPSPRHSNPLEYVSDSFASRWYDANADLVAYDKDLAIRLVRAIIQLNDVLYGGVVQDPWSHVQIKRNVTSRDFIDAFRRYDPRCLVPDDLLDRIHASIRREPLSQARNAAHSTTQDQPILLKRPIPSRLTYRMQSEPIIVRIPQADPSLIIHLHGNELIFDPPYLSFTRSAEASFRITGTALGLKTVSFSRSGTTALLYTGLPLSSPIVIERSFMRNTFQIAFANHQGSKRRYMFSVDDPVMRHNWTVSLKRQIDIASAGQQEQAESASPFHRAAEQIAFRVLQETLIPSPSADWSNSRPPFSSQYFPPQPRVRPLSPRRGSLPNTNGKVTLQSAHVRSKSRSQVYYRHGLGKLEHQQLDTSLPANGDATDSPETDAEDVSSPEGGTRLWGGKELEMICQQNSAIVQVLALSQSEPANAGPSPSPAPLRPVTPVR